MIDLARRIIKYVFGKDPGGEAIRYIIVGGLTTLVNFGLFTLMYEVAGIDANISNIISISVSILFAYVTNKLFVFKQRTDTFNALAIEFFKFTGSRLFTMALEIGIVALFNDILHWNATLGKAISQVFVIIANYFISKLIVFRKSNKNGGK